MAFNTIYRQFEKPWIYRLSQFILAPGSKKATTQRIKQLLKQLPTAHRILEIGCGPSSFLWQMGLHPIGLDLSHVYTLTFHHHGYEVINGSAVALPFLDRSFDGVWSIGLLHHLSDGEAQQAVIEMMRICLPGGYIVIFDSVLPNPSWRRPVAYFLRRVDRGRFVRREEEIKNLLPLNRCFKMERITYSLNGLEAMLVYSVCK